MRCPNPFISKTDPDSNLIYLKIQYNISMFWINYIFLKTKDKVILTIDFVHMCVWNVYMG